MSRSFLVLFNENNCKANNGIISSWEKKQLDSMNKRVSWYNKYFPLYCRKSFKKSVNLALKLFGWWSAYLICLIYYWLPSFRDHIQLSFHEGVWNQNTFSNICLNVVKIGNYQRMGLCTHYTLCNYLVWRSCLLEYRNICPYHGQII